MDIGSLRLVLGDIRGELESNTRNTPDDFGQLRHEIDALEDRLQNVQQWLHSSDPPALAGFRTSLGQVGHTINVALEKAQRHVTDCIYTRDTGSPNDLCRCSADLRECVLLVDFTLNVLSLPIDGQSQSETEDLRRAAKLLCDTQGCSQDERITLLRTKETSSSSTSNLRIFIDSLLEGETDFGDRNKDVTSAFPAPQRKTEALFTSRRTNARDELHLPNSPQQRQVSGGSEAVPSCFEARRGPRQSSYPSTSQEVAAFYSPSSLRKLQLSPGLPEEPAHQSSGERFSTSKQQIARRPVARASTTSTVSVTAPPSSSRTQTTSVNRQRSQTMGPRLKPRTSRRTGTRDLFTQATRSLSNLTQEPEHAGMAEDAELPPPYLEIVSSVPPPSDAKRRHADSVSSANSHNLSTFALIQDNLLDGLRERVKQGLSINEVDPLTKRTALMEAANLERTGAVSIMLKASNQVHQKDLEGNSPLHFAASQGNPTICNALLESGASVEDYNLRGETPIALAARRGHTDAVDSLLNGWTIQRGTAAALTKGYLEALKSGNVNTVVLFIERNIKPKKIKESVLCAAEGGSVSTLDYILAQKCSLKERNSDGWTALHFAAERGHIAMVEKLLALGLSWKAQTKKIGENALAIAIRNRQNATANCLMLNKDAKVNRYDNDRVSPLYHAVRIGDLGLMSMLLNAGAKLDVQSKYGFTIMHTAVAYGHAHLVAELITRGVSIEEKLTEPELDPSKKTNEGARRGYWAEIRWPHAGTRPLHLSLEFGHDDVANLLIAAGAKIDAMDFKDWRPLHYASFSARPAIVELLLSKGASPHAKTDDNNTPLSVGFRAHGLNASEEDKIRVWELLQGAMNSKRKTKMQQFTGFMSGGSGGRIVEKRNRTWLTAELAASLHYEEEAQDGASADGSELTLSTTDQRQDEVNGQEGGRVNSGMSLAQDAKTSPR